MTNAIIFGTIALLIFAVIFAAKRWGGSGVRAKQSEANFKEIADAQERAADAARRVGGSLTDDELNERLREHGAIRD